MFLSPEAPYPLIGGGALRSASLVEYLSRRYAVHAIVFRQPNDPDPAAAIPPGKVDRLDIVDLPIHSRHTMARALRNSVRLVRGAPPLMDRFAGFTERIAEAVAGRQYEAAIIEHFWCAPYLEQVRPHAKQVILDLHNIESTWHQSVAASSGPAKAWALRRFATASVALERKWLPGFDAILVTSARDAALLREVVPNLRVTVYPNALPEIAAPPRQEKEEIVFSGNLEYAPNIAAVRHFAARIWPSLRKRWPNLRWKIVGKNPAAVRKLVQGDSRIHLTGFVEDAVAALAEARVAVVPVVSGSGTRVKILEAWAAGTPVVSTAIGAEGLEARNGEHLLLADEPDRFADAVSTLLASPTERARIGAAGRELYEQRYTWPVAWRSIEGIFGNPAAISGNPTSGEKI
ncbi:MAG TPA: glycosyltransferase family 4 protein [Bryobacteraceae bacterium]|nr:glycosyltransferase family 4 protein [Bryobacteraceae bacterium]